MNSMKQISAVLICFLIQAAVVSQEPQSASPLRNASSQEVTIIIQQQQLRFSAPASAQEIMLEVFNKAGELVYDNGLVTGAEMTWALRDARGGIFPAASTPTR